MAMSSSTREMNYEREVIRDSRGKATILLTSKIVTHALNTD